MALQATFSADFDQFEKSIQSATVKLQVFDRATKNATRDLTRELNAFSGQKLAVEAGRMGEAIKRLGGEGGVAAGLLKLTDAELKRVSDTAANAVDKFKRLGVEVPPSIATLHQEIAKLPKELDKVPPAANATTVSFGKLVASFVTAQAVIGTVKTAYRAYVDLLSSSIDSYAESERAQKQLTAALVAQGTATPTVIAQYKALSDQFQRTTVFSDDLVSEMQALLTQVGNVMPDQMGAALKASTDLASGLGIDLRQATMLVGKAFEGETGTLKRYGIVIDEATLKAQGITAVLDAIQQRFGGQAAAEVDTYAGQIQQLANNWDNLKERLGEFIATDDTLRGALAALNLLIDDMSRASGEAQTPVGKLWQAWSNYIELGQTVTPVVAQFHRLLGDMADEAERAADAVDRSKESLDRFNTSIKSNELKPLTMSAKEYREAQEDLTRSAQKLIDQRLEDALRKQEQAAIAAAKAFATLKDSFSGAAVVQSGMEMKRVLDALGGPAGVATDKLEAMHKAFKTAAEGARTLKNVKLAEEFDRLAKATSPMAVFQEKWNVKLGEFVIQQRIAAGDSDEFTAAILAQALAVKDNTDAINLGIIATTNWTPPWAALKGAIEQTLPKMEDAAQKTKRLKDANEEAIQSLQDMAQAFANLAQIAGDNDLGKVFQQIGELVGSFALAAKGVDSFGKGIANIQSGNFTAGLSQMVSGLAGVVAAMEQATRGTDKLKATLGGAATGFAVGGVWGAIIGGVIGFVRASGNAREEARALAKQFQDSFRAMSVAVQQALPKAGLLGMGDLLRKALGTAKTIEDLKKVQELIDEIMQKFAEAEEQAADLFGQMLDAGFQIPEQFRHQFEALLPQLTGANKKMLEQLIGSEVNWRKMQEAAEKFGIDIDSLGKKFQAAKLKDRAKEIIDVWELLTGGSPEAQGGVLFGLKDEIQQLVLDFLKFGGAIPENFRPLIAELIRSKQLFDENGNLIEDIGQIKFGDKIVSEFDKIIKAIEALIETLQGLYNMQPPEQRDRSTPDPGNRTPTNPGDTPTLPAPGDRFTPQYSTLGAATVRAITNTSSSVVVVMVDGGGSPDETIDRVFAELPEGLALNRQGVRSAMTALFARKR